MPRILIVEDDPGIAITLRSGLEKTLSEFQERQIVVAKSIAEFRELVPKVNPDVIFMDLSLTDSTWEETLKEVATTDPKVPVVVMTGHAVERVRERLESQIDIVSKDGGFFKNSIRALIRALERSSRDEERKNFAEIRKGIQILNARHVPPSESA